ncbi:hypothetical protein K469DRAFT_655479 [Zopfia rhizophila CBS 207.26]|uniref:Peptidase A1 domain-containing protein n=1 Tax=Zopfia rhizophila CBS 207.26 TaxID=1314779 RepID=A0A6A6EHU3_9PEZI|nr:hypothetical protein K469DRAFT_655479 [Zopfia rhizophila CBS 207.26]
MSFFDMDMDGKVSHDTLHVAGLEIRDFVFGEATSVILENIFSGYDGHDGFLDLAPNSEAATLGMPSPFSRMVEDGLLDKNLFAIKVPRGAIFGFDSDKTKMPSPCQRLVDYRSPSSLLRGRGRHALSAQERFCWF